MRFTNDKPMMSSFLVPVDDSITQLTVLLTSPSAAPVAMTMMPLGKNYVVFSLTNLKMKTKLM